MRLIDADALLQEIEECANAVEIQIHLGKCDKNVAKGMLSGLALVRESILRKPTAYNPEKVVEEIKSSATDNDGLIVKDGNEPMIWKSKAIDIVKRGGVK